jgi:hypothetical protein
MSRVKEIIEGHHHSSIAEIRLAAAWNRSQDHGLEAFQSLESLQVWETDLLYLHWIHKRGTTRLAVLVKGPIEEDSLARPSLGTSKADCALERRPDHAMLCRQVATGTERFHVEGGDTASAVRA